MTKKSKSTQENILKLISKIANESEIIMRNSVSYIKLLDGKYHMINNNKTDDKLIEEYLKNALMYNGCDAFTIGNIKNFTSLIKNFKRKALLNANDVGGNLTMTNIVPTTIGVYDANEGVFRPQNNDDIIFFEYAAKYKTKDEMRILKLKPIIKSIERYISSICNNDKNTETMLWQAIRHSIVPCERLNEDSYYNNSYWIYNDVENKNRSGAKFVYDLVMNIKSSNNSTYIDMNIEEIPKFEKLTTSKKQVIELNLPIQTSIIGYTGKTNVIPTIGVKKLVNRSSRTTMRSLHDEPIEYVYEGSMLEFTEGPPVLERGRDWYNPNYKYFKFIKLNNINALSPKLVNVINEDSDVRDYFFTKALNFDNKDFTPDENHISLINEFYARDSKQI